MPPFDDAAGDAILEVDGLAQSQDQLGRDSWSPLRWRCGLRHLLNLHLDNLDHCSSAAAEENYSDHPDADPTSGSQSFVPGP